MRWSRMLSHRVLLTTVLVGLYVSACKETVTEPIAVGSVTVTGGGGTLRLGQSAQLTTTLKSTEGWTLPNVGVTWTSSDAAKATISPSGQVTAVSRGPVTLTAAAGGVTGTGTVTVIGVQSIALAPETLSVIVTQTRPMTATTVLDAGVTVTPTWRSLDTTIAKVDTAGRVTAKSTTGLVRIEVTAEDKKDTAVVRVIPVPVVSVVVTPDTATRGPGQTVQLTATPKDSIGGTLTGRTVTWSSSDASKATVSTTGLVSGVATGSAVITATIEGKTANSNITIRVPINEITLTQSSCTGSGSQSGTTARLYTTETCQYSATPRDASGNTLLGRNLTWSVSDTTIAKLDGAAFAHPTTQLPTVKLIPQKGGIITVTVSGEGKSATLTIEALEPVASVSLSSNTAIPIGATRQVSATLRSANGSTLTGRAVAWSIADTNIASVAGAGLVTAKTIGNTTITATSEGKSGTATISVTSPTPTNGLIAQYPLDGTAQSLVESSQNGELFSTAWDRDRNGRANAAAHFRGGTSVRIPGSVLNNLSTGSFAMWIRWDSLTTYQVIFAKVIGSSAATYYFTLNGCTNSNGFPTGGAEPGQICWHSQNYSANPEYVASNAKLVQGTWSHVAVTWTSNTIRIYLNGALDKSVSCTGCGILNNSSTGTTLGRWSTTENIGDFRGAIDDLLIYNRALTASEIEALAEVESNGTGSVASIDMVPSTLALLPGTSQKISAFPKDQSGNSVSAGTILWTTSDSSIATVSSAGVVSAIKPGSARITATVSGVSLAAPVSVQKADRIAMSVEHACGVTAAGGLSCWGNNSSQEFGINRPDLLSSSTPIPAATGVTFRSVTAGQGFTCGLSTDQFAYCWGSNDQGQLGDGTTVDRSLPVRVAGGVKFSSIQTDYNFVCGLSIESTVYCWGRNDYGQTGNGVNNAGPVTIPTAVAGGLTFARLVVGAEHACGLLFDGSAYCWGNGGWSQLGHGGFGSSPSWAPTKVFSDVKFTEIFSAVHHNCGLAEDSTAYCWGLNKAGALGDGSTVNRNFAKAVFGSQKFKTAMSMGENHTCAIGSSTGLLCWGGGESGQIGNGQTSNQLTPISVSTVFTAIDLTGGQFGNCALASDGTAYCWGRNGKGQLGDGSLINRSLPTRVSGFTWK